MPFLGVACWCTGTFEALPVFPVGNPFCVIRVVLGFARGRAGRDFRLAVFANRAIT